MSRGLALAVVLLARTAHADVDTLRDLLGEAQLIVRGSPIDTARTGAFADTQFAVSETLKGDPPGETIVVRDLAEGATPLDRGEDVILLLDARTPDRVYPLHHPVGRYRVDGDNVIVNASGVDGANVSAKDLRPRAPDEYVPVDRFRAFASGTWRSPDAPPVTIESPPPHAPAHGSAAPSPVPPPAPSRTARWPWLAAALAVVLLVLYGVRRAR